MNWPRKYARSGGVGQNAIPSHKEPFHRGTPGRQYRAGKCCAGSDRPSMGHGNDTRRIFFGETASYRRVKPHSQRLSFRIAVLEVSECFLRVMIGGAKL